jgi:polar amino acid transport system substrate-binding protein
MRKSGVVCGVLLAVLFFGLNTASAQSVDRIKKAGVLKIGSTATGVPTTFLDTNTGKISGIMVDVAQAFADHLGVKLEVIETPWASLIPSLQSHKIDLICAAMSITDQRKEVIDFSDPIYPYAETLLVKKGDPKAYKGISDIKALTVGAQVGTVYAKNLEKEGIKELKIYDNIQDIMREITVGRIDAGVVDGPVAGWLVKTKPEFQVKIAEAYVPVWQTQIGAGINKEDKDLKVEVDKVVQKLHQDGNIKQILTKWGQ